MVRGVCPQERSCRVLLGFLWMPVHQKEGPGSEDKLHEHCRSRKMNSGCSRKPTRTCPALTDSLEPPWRDGKRPLIQDTCLYDASSTWGLEPAAGPEWAQRAASDLPLCKDSCQARGKTAAPASPGSVPHNVPSVQWGFLSPLRFLLPTPSILQGNQEWLLHRKPTVAKRAVAAPTCGLFWPREPHGGGSVL